MNWTPTEYKADGGLYVRCWDGLWKISRYKSESLETVWLKADGTWGGVDDESPDATFGTDIEAKTAAEEWKAKR